MGFVVTAGFIIFAISYVEPTESTHNKKFFEAWYGGFNILNLITYFSFANIYVIFTSILSLFTVQDWAVMQVIELWHIK